MKPFRQRYIRPARSRHPARSALHVARSAVGDLVGACPLVSLCPTALDSAARLVIWHAYRIPVCLASGAPSQGKRASLRSSTIMLRQPLQRLGGMQASDIDIYRKITREKSQTMVGPGQGGGGRARCHRHARARALCGTWAVDRGTEGACGPQAEYREGNAAHCRTLSHICRW